MANPFEHAFAQFRSGLTQSELDKFRQTTAREVLEAASHIRQSKDGSRLKKLDSFLRPMEQYAKVVELFANSTPFIPYIWGPIKYILQHSSTPSYLDAYIDTIAKLSLELPQMDRYNKLFIDNPEIQRLLAMVYANILEFHRRTLKVFKQKAWEKPFTKYTSNFSKNLESTIQSLRQSKGLLENEVRLLEIERSQRSRDLQEHQFQMAQEEERKRQVFTIMEKLQPASSDTDQWKGANRWKGIPTTGNWLFNHELMTRWMRVCEAPSILWLNGIPGAGKTILASRVIAELDRSIDRKVIFFYFIKGDSLRDSLIVMLRSLLAQLIRLAPGILPYVYGEISASVERVLGSPETLMMLLENIVARVRELWVVLDGLDECEKKERKKILSWGSKICLEQAAGVKILLTSQDKADIRVALSSVPKSSSIYLHAPGHQEDIRAYVTRKAAKRKKQFDLPIEIEQDIVYKVDRHANGMFLFARLVLDHLKNQETLECLQRELDPSRFPTDLDEVVERLFPNEEITEVDAEKMYPGETNRCFIESFMKLRRNRQLSSLEKQEMAVTRRIQQECEFCQLLSLQESHLKISLINLMFGSISCQVCHTLCQAIVLLEQDWLKTRHSSSVLDIEKRQGMLCFQVQSTEVGPETTADRTKSRWGFPLIIHLFSQYELDGAWSTLSIHQPIASHSGSDECLGKIQEWLNACKNDHLSCSQQSRLKYRSEGDLIASRIIDLGTSDQPTPTLISTETLNVSRWTTLSYCWGGRSSFITTEANLTERQKYIPWSTIPATFQDAMRLTHRLGIRYIWIDAVCIIQDSVQDWRAEASKMGNIYQNAYLVIAADLAVSCGSGIFAPRERYSLPIDVGLGDNERSHARQKLYVEKGSSLDYTSQQSEPNEWHTGSYLRHSVLESNSRALNKRWVNPTLQRAWCFQERMLATRIIHFTAAELIWECKTKIDCECSLRKSSGNTLKQSLDTSLEKAAAIDYPDFTTSRATASKMWWKLVVEYSWCDLTVPSDKLPAISGLAQLFPQLGRYWAGMWDLELPLSLLWREELFEDSDAPEPRLAEKYVAPSWSWASAIHPIHEPDLSSTEILAEVVNVADTPAAADIYGQIVDAHLVLKGLVLDGMIRHISNSFFGKPMTQIQLLSEDGNPIPGMDYQGARLSFRGDYRLRKVAQRGGISTQKVLSVAIKSTTSSEQGRVLDCIVLQRSATKDGFYERIGLVTCIDSIVESERVFKKTVEVTII